MTAKPEPLVFQLYFRKQVMNRMGGVWVAEEDEEKLAEVPDVPPGFQAVRGYHGDVAQRANELNRKQELSGFSRYFFFPDVAPMAAAGEKS